MQRRSYFYFIFSYLRVGACACSFMHACMHVPSSVCIYICMYIHGFECVHMCSHLQACMAWLAQTNCHVLENVMPWPLFIIWTSTLKCLLLQDGNGSGLFKLRSICLTWTYNQPPPSELHLLGENLKRVNKNEVKGDLHVKIKSEGKRRKLWQKKTWWVTKLPSRRYFSSIFYFFF